MGYYAFRLNDPNRLNEIEGIVAEYDLVEQQDGKVPEKQLERLSSPLVHQRILEANNVRQWIPGPNAPSVVELLKYDPKSPCPILLQTSEGLENPAVQTLVQRLGEACRTEYYFDLGWGIHSLP